MQERFTRETEKTINDLVRDMKAISLEEMSAVRLMNRCDTKFLVPVSLLPGILQSVYGEYRVQEVAGNRNASYETIYYDSELQEFFLEHTNGKLNRRKVRQRTYVDSDLHFMEVKRKTNKGKTNKTRVPVSGYPEKHESEAVELVRAEADADLLSLTPSLTNRFTRITLVNSAMTERVTIDFHLSFGKYGTEEIFYSYDLAVIEVKQDKNSRSFIKEALRERRIKKTGFSKYCYGMVLTGQVRKVNNLKRKFRRIQKIIHHEYLA